MKKKNLLIIITLCVLIGLSCYIKFYTPQTTLNPVSISQTERPTPTVIATPTPTSIPSTAANELEYEPQDKMQIILEASLTGGVADVNGWGYKTEYGYYVVANDRWHTLTVWFDPYEREHKSMSVEHMWNGAIIYPVNEPYTNKFDNTFIPFALGEIKSPEYNYDDDNIYWLLYENFNGDKTLEHHPPED
jgi:hypothetical protein